MTPFQRPILRCACGAEVIVEQVSPWEFTYTCAVCHDSRLISWAHKDPPPAFTPAGPQQQELWT